MSDDLVHLLRDTWSAVERAALNQTRDRAVAGSPGLRPVHIAILQAVGPHGARISDVARQLGITRQAVAQTVASLLDKGILEVAPDPTDGRAKLLRYTARGKDWHESAARAGDQLESAFREALGPERTERFLAELGQLRRIGLRYSKSGGPSDGP
ncbi:MAG TPA: MarR family winged helix-turn-helix transcriptional regulator [Pseudonocardia sp.]|jgi:DNA-binding MarR family transcriptional regulator